MQATLPVGVQVKFAVSGTANQLPVAGGNVLVITASGCDVAVSCGLDATASDPTNVWENLFIIGGSVQTWRRPINTKDDMVSVIAADGSSTGTCYIVACEGN